MFGRKVQTTGEVRPADFPDEVRVTADHESVEGTGQADLEAFAGAFECRLLVDDNHDCAALEPLHHDKSSIHEFSRGVPPRGDNAMVQLYRLALTSRVHRGR
jgi:hypothetical protein